MSHTPELDPQDFPSQKKSWSDLKEVIARNELASLQRSVQQERFYRNYSNKMKRYWRSVYDFVLHHKFDFEKVAILPPTQTIDSFIEYHSQDCEGDLSSLPDLTAPPPGMQWTLKKPYNCKEHPPNQNQVLARNDFPYYFEDDMEHWCLWKLGGDVTEEEIEKAIQDMRKSGSFQDFVHWVNPIHLKSLPDIDHAHIVCLRKDH